MAEIQTLAKPEAGLDWLLNTLEVEFVALSQCSVSPGYRMELGGIPAPGIHYNLHGNGRVLIGKKPPVQLKPHTMIIVPAHTPFAIEVDCDLPAQFSIKTVIPQTSVNDGVFRNVAGEENPEVILFCGYFNAAYGAKVALLENLMEPIVEQFDETDFIDQKLGNALRELVAQEIGCKAMSSALLKQVIVSILRRSVQSPSLWLERFSVLSDPQIAKAFSAMVNDPGAPHTVITLSETAYMSRSAFMARFTEIFGRPAMTVLRDLRLKKAAQQLKDGMLTVSQIAYNAGYNDKSSFIKAFKKAYGLEPSKFREIGNVE